LLATGRVLSQLTI